MKGLIPKEKLFYLPYSRRTVPTICFDAREVFASLLYWPLLNCDENYLFNLPEKILLLIPPNHLSLVTSTQGSASERHTKPW
jgi:hypothetical protein